MNDEQIEQEIARILDSEPGLLYGASPTKRIAVGDRVFDALSRRLSEDVDAAGKEGEALDGHAG